MLRNKLILLAFLLITALFSTSRLVYLALYGLACLYFLLVWGARRAWTSLVVERSLTAAKAFIGQDIQVTITVVNRSRFPLGWLGLSASRQANVMLLGGQSAVDLLPGRGRIVHRYRLAGARRGCYPLGPIRLFGGDPLGWSEWEALQPDPGDTLVVYPKITPLIDPGLPMVRPFGSIRDKSRAHEDPSRLSGIRDYQPGDSLRRIHWKATATSGRLQVKELMPSVTAEIALLLNLNEAEYPRGAWETLGETAIEAAASLVAHFASFQIAVGFATNGRDPMGGTTGSLIVPPGAGPAQAEIILTVLARIQVAPGGDFAGLAGARGRESAWGTRIFLLTPHWHQGLSDLVLALKRDGKAPVPVIIGSRADLAAAAATGQPSLLAKPDVERGGVTLSLAD